MGGWTVWEKSLWSVGIVLAAVLAALVVHRAVFAIARKLTARGRNLVDQSLVRHMYRPARLILPLAALQIVLPGLPLAPCWIAALRHFLVIALIAAAAWLVIALANVGDDYLAGRYRVDVSDNLTARRIRTQVQVLRRIMFITVGVVAGAAMLMTFPSVWNIGAGLFASAGVAGLIVGMAARPTLSNLLAGVQIALSEPIRIEDAVIVEGEFGWIEDITTTYVVVRIWDLRRLVVPLAYFIEHPFQNWTRASADLLGTVFVYTDYSVPVDEVRAELHRILKSTEMWDGKVWGLQVTDANAHVMEMRALMSASNSGKAWDLRCYVREKLIDFLQRNYPQSLPRTRAEIRQVAAAD
jgi:small-conductance mechanosensitive channel